MKLFTYVIPPMDFGWGWISTLDEHEARIRQDVDAEQGSYGSLQLQLTEFRRFVQAAQRAGFNEERRAGREGQEHVMVLPSAGDPEPALALIWKLDNNGDTVVISQVPLTYLDEWGRG
jgi:hypothetical protein